MPYVPSGNNMNRGRRKRRRRRRFFISFSG
jgi:hypothetical protein